MTNPENRKNNTAGIEEKFVRPNRRVNSKSFYKTHVSSVTEVSRSLVRQGGGGHPTAPLRGPAAGVNATYVEAPPKVSFLCASQSLQGWVGGTSKSS